MQEELVAGDSGGGAEKRVSPPEVEVNGGIPPRPPVEAEAVEAEAFSVSLISCIISSSLLSRCRSSAYSFACRIAVPCGPKEHRTASPRFTQLPQGSLRSHFVFFLMHVAQLSGRRTPREPRALGGGGGGGAGAELLALEVVDSECTGVVAKVAEGSCWVVRELDVSSG